MKVYQLKKVSKGMRKQLYKLALKEARQWYSHKGDNYTNVENVIPDKVYPWQVEKIWRDYIYSNCKTNTGVTSFGNWLGDTCEVFQKELYRQYEKFGFIKIEN